MRDDDTRATQRVDVELVRCDVCGIATTNLSASKCLNCLDVEMRLPVYLRSEKGREKVRQMLQEAEKL